MPRSLTSRGAASAATVLALVLAAAVQAAGSLHVHRFTARFRPGPNDRLRLVAEAREAGGAAATDPGVAGLVVSVEDTELLRLPDPEGRGRLKSRRPGRWTYRSGKSGSRMSWDARLGQLRLRARKLDLSALESTDGRALTVALELGGERHEGSVVVGRHGRRLWKLPSSGGTVPAPGDPGGGAAPEVTQLAAGTQSGVENARNVVVRSEQEWAALWAQHVSILWPRPAPPAVDFGRSMVLGVFLGNRPDPSHQVELARVSRLGDGLQMDYRDVRIVGGGCAFPAVVAQPYVLVRVPRAEGDVSFRGSVVQRSCP